MSQPGFFNQNRNRSFPFVDGRQGQLPDEAVVDAGFIMGVDSGFDASADSVYLKTVSRVGDRLVFEFASDAPLMHGSLLTFTRNRGDPDDLTEQIDSLTMHNVSSSAEACDEPLWLGYLVTGRLDSLFALLADGQRIDFADGGGAVEPALVQNLAGSYVKSFALANDDRTRVSAPAGCPPVVWPHPVDVTFQGPLCLLGEVVLRGGFNCEVLQDSQANSLTLTAAAGAGAGVPCASVPLFEGEAPPPGSSLLEGGPACDEVLRSFNGVGGRMYVLAAGTGVTVEAVPDENKVVVDVSMAGLLSCRQDVSVSTRIL